ncbi:DMT family transporter [Wukongibacter baidiensis]|uniref:DMT family transporter n=1 Tax=Wukongibacter baidiensis TaxID=1723361 RepID=UPI003D7FEFE3
MNNDRKKAIIYLIITAVLWSIGGLFIKLVDWNPMAIAGARSGIAAAVMLIYLKEPVIRPLSTLKKLGAFAYASLLILFVTANKLTTSANAILLQFTAPIWVALFSRWFLKEKIRKSDWAAIIAVMLGMLLFFVGDLQSGNLIGNFVGVLSGIAMAAFIILLKLQADDSPMDITLVGNIITFVICFPFFFLSVPSINSISGLLILGVFQLGIPYILYTSSIKHVSTVEAVLIPFIEPLLNPVWVFLVTSEAPNGYGFLGGTIVVISLISRGLYQQRKKIIL